jgi:hypothetical protein
MRGEESGRGIGHHGAKGLQRGSALQSTRRREPSSESAHVQDDLMGRVNSLCAPKTGTPREWTSPNARALTTT